ncbi:MAG: competence/damage-inducible protein A [Ignavibacteria bacterium]|nr:competence/damage-inducible protein A [Ignavibacteria bacterium]
MLKVSILTVGDEILIGQIVNSNASWISQKCIETGASIIEHRTVGDVEEEIIQAVYDLQKKSDIVLITGGLGPTIDDLTKPSLTKYFNDELVFDEQVFEWIKDFFFKRGQTEISERNKNLAYVPRSCKPLKNEFGTAPGMLFEQDGKIIVSMPGVPKEMQFIMNQYVLPLIKDKITKENCLTNHYCVLQTCGIPESVIADKLIGIDKEFSDVKIAFLPSYKGVRLRLQTENLPLSIACERIDQIKNVLYKRIGDYIYGEGEISLSEVIGKMLIDRNETVAVAESCTGGLLGSEFTKISGSSKYFIGGIISYSNDVKINTLGVNKNTIDKFGAVSEETAIEMAKNVRILLNTTYGLSITGVAGPTGGTPNKPVGTVWIGFSSPTTTFAKRYQFGGDREINRERSVYSALTLLYFQLKGLSI